MAAVSYAWSRIAAPARGRALGSRRREILAMVCQADSKVLERSLLRRPASLRPPVLRLGRSEIAEYGAAAR